MSTNNLRCRATCPIILEGLLRNSCLQKALQLWIKPTGHHGREIQGVSNVTIPLFGDAFFTLYRSTGLAAYRIIAGITHQFPYIGGMLKAIGFGQNRCRRSSTYSFNTRQLPHALNQHGVAGNEPFYLLARSLDPRTSCLLLLTINDGTAWALTLLCTILFSVVRCSWSCTQ